MNVNKPIAVFFGFSLLLGSCAQKHEKKEAASAYTEPAKAIAEGKTLLQNGDLILRTDDDVVSASLRNFSKTDKSYSHCGIVYQEDSAWYVYHLMAGDENPSDLMERERFESFVDPYRKSRYGIFRYQLSADEQARFQQQVYTYMAGQMHFDKQFDLKSDDKLYCAEMVYKGLMLATNGRVTIPVTVRNNFRPDRIKQDAAEIKRFEFIALDNLYLNPFCKEIKRYRYPNKSLEENK